MKTLNAAFGSGHDIDRAASAPTLASARALLAEYAAADAPALAELLDACIGKAAGDRGRAIARLTSPGRIDPLVALDLVTSAQDDLLGLPCDVAPSDPGRLIRTRPEDLDRALRYQIGRLTTLANLLTATAAR